MPGVSAIVGITTPVALESKKGGSDVVSPNYNWRRRNFFQYKNSKKKSRLVLAHQFIFSNKYIITSGIYTYSKTRTKFHRRINKQTPRLDVCSGRECHFYRVSCRCSELVEACEGCVCFVVTRVARGRNSPPRCCSSWATRGIANRCVTCK